MKTIKQTIYKMMMTSTGKQMCDSGFGERGRHWQRNQMDYPTIDAIEKEPSVEFEQPEQWYTLKKDGEFVRRNTNREYFAEFESKDGYTIEKDSLDSHDLLATVNIFHYLTEVLDVDGLCNDFNALECKDWDGDKAYGISEAQQEWLENHGFTFGDTWNSYNGECNLSQTLQGANMYLGATTNVTEFPEYILLQIHQGADVRGGYTDAKLFKVEAEYFDTNPTLYGSIDGVPVDTGYDGYNFTDENGKAVPMTPDSKISVYTITD